MVFALLQMKFFLSIGLVGIICQSSLAQVDTVRCKQMAKEINHFRIRNLRLPLRYNTAYQAGCDEFISSLPNKHAKLIPGQLGEVYMGFGSELSAWRNSRPHRKILLNRKAKEICIGAFKDKSGTYWYVGRTYQSERRKK
jgi:hypothetical protein